MSWLQSKHGSPYIQIHSYKRKGIVKQFRQQRINQKEESNVTVKTQPGLNKNDSINNITEDIVNQYIQNNIETVSNYLRNQRAMGVQKKTNECYKFTE